MSVSTYNAKDTSIIVDGVYITGLGEDMYSAEKDEDLRSDSVGAQGDVVSNVVNNPLGTMTIYVQPTSPQKKFLMSLKNRTTPFSVWAVNKKLGERVGGTKALLQKFPSIDRGSEAEDMEFVFRIYDYTADAT